MHAIRLGTASQTAAPHLTLTGVIDGDQATLPLGFSLVRDGVDAGVAASFATVELRDAVDSVLATYPVPLIPVCRPPRWASSVDEAPAFVMDTVIPIVDGTVKMRVSSDQGVLAEREFPTAPPQVSAFAAAPADAGYQLDWQVDHPQGAPTSYIVLITPDYGKSWVPVAQADAAEPIASITVRPRGIRRSQEVEFALVVTDGLNTVMSRSEAIPAAFFQPEVAIVSPTAGQLLRPANRLVGVSSVPLDSDDEVALVWSSSLDGELGRGDTLDVELSPGTHDITLALVAADGEELCATSVAALVGALPPPLPLQISQIDMSADPPRYEGSCPVTINFTATLHLTGSAATVRYQWIRSDGAQSGVLEAAVPEDAGTFVLSTSWTLGDVGTSFTGWQALRVLDPQILESPRAEIYVSCNTA